MTRERVGKGWPELFGYSARGHGCRYSSKLGRDSRRALTCETSSIYSSTQNEPDPTTAARKVEVRYSKNRQVSGRQDRNER